ncbi:hypothetical protein RM156_08280 [Pantoea agglomerans]|uniref:hypothetical protein n=1 Tax=Enterobacter agglomerans TaxID=549 RepID=UPI002899CA45|nr:hypothetical protein [Pantoea agglomerans]WNK68454.1 hypothetical protein RM156_08280 [Pantoea agglomerans]
MDNFKRMNDDEIRHEIELVRHAEDRFSGNDVHSLQCIRVIFVSLIDRIYEELSIRQDEEITKSLTALTGPDFKPGIREDETEWSGDWPDADY